MFFELPDGCLYKCMETSRLVFQSDREVQSRSSRDSTLQANMRIRYIVLDKNPKATVGLLLVDHICQFCANKKR